MRAIDQMAATEGMLKRSTLVVRGNENIGKMKETLGGGR